LIKEENWDKLFELFSFEYGKSCCI